jgi:hypothetical protein
MWELGKVGFPSFPKRGKKVVASPDLTQSFHKGSVNLLTLHPSRRRAVAAQPDAGIERGLKTHQVSGLLP